MFTFIINFLPATQFVIWNTFMVIYVLLFYYRLLIFFPRSQLSIRFHFVQKSGQQVLNVCSIEETTETT